MKSTDNIKKNIYIYILNVKSNDARSSMLLLMQTCLHSFNLKGVFDVNKIYI